MQIYKSIQGVMLDMSAIEKSRRNAQQGFNFRGIDEVYNALHPLFAKHGLFCTTKILDIKHQPTTSKQGTAGVHVVAHYEFTFYAVDGTYVACQAIGEAMDYGDKASNKAASIAHKYALLQTFLIPTEDLDDPDEEVHEIVRPAEKPREVYTTQPAGPQGSVSFTPEKFSFKTQDDPQYKKLLAYLERRGRAGDIARVAVALTGKTFTQEAVDAILERRV